MSTKSPRPSLRTPHGISKLRSLAQFCNRTVLHPLPASRHPCNLIRMTSLVAGLLLLSALIPPLQAQSSDPSLERSRPIAAGVLDAAHFPGPDWLAKVNSAAVTLSRSRGGTIQIPDSIAGTAATSGTIPSNVTLEFTGSGTFGFCQIEVGQFTKIYNKDALLQMSRSDCIGINQTNSAPLQKTDKFILDGVRLDCNKQPNSTGIFVGANHAQTAMHNVTVVNCTTAGLRLDGAQFGEYSNVSLYNNFVGLKVYTTLTGGGGNSNTFYGLKAVGNTVGVLIAETSKFGMGADYFVNPSFLSNSVAAMAVFGNVWESDVHWYGGAPEDNGGGPSTITIDGHLVKRSSIYANHARISLIDTSIAEAKITPFIRAENSSTVVLNNVSGYGKWDGTLVSTDSGSATTLEGHMSTLGTIQNVISYPSILRTSGYVRMFGAPVVSSNALIPNHFSGNSIAPPVADRKGTLSSTTVTDPQMGPVTAVVHTKRRGSQEDNRASFGNVVSSPSSQSSTILVSVLVKASVNCTYVMGGYPDGYSVAPVPLAAEKWTRVVILKGKAAAGTGFTLVGWPDDSTGPTISFARLEVLSTPTDSPESAGFIGTVLATGAVNPNGFDRPGR